ncbi:hypothetical protein GGF32_009575 [Allomyces javanicus]|nr:hypothetical protein GGF32_009575 [Allomyces javanicus]
MLFSTARLGLGATTARFAPRLAVPRCAAVPFNLIQRQLGPTAAVTTITDLRAFHTAAALRDKSRSAADRYRSKCALARQGHLIIYVDGSWRMKAGEASATMYAIHFALSMVEMWESGAVIHTDSQWAYDLIKGRGKLRGEWKGKLNDLGKSLRERLVWRDVKLVKVESKADLGNRKAHKLAAMAHENWACMWGMYDLQHM